MIDVVDELTKPEVVVSEFKVSNAWKERSFISPGSGRSPYHIATLYRKVVVLKLGLYFHMPRPCSTRHCVDYLREAIRWVFKKTIIHNFSSLVK